MLKKTMNIRIRRSQRRGSISVIAAFMITLVAGIVAFSVDYGYLVKTRTDLQRAADSAALAAAQDLVLNAEGEHDVETIRATVREYAAANLGDFNVADADIEVGRFDPNTVYTSPDLLNSGTFDAVRVTLRRDGSSNPLVPLFFARVFGQTNAEVTASAAAALQKAELMPPGADILPFATPQVTWDDVDVGEEWSIYGDGKMKDDDGDDIPGNWGTVDIGNSNNSTADLNNQILDGLRQSDLDALYFDGHINQRTHIDTSVQIWMSADTGLSSGIKNSIRQIHGSKRLIPIFDQSNNAPGENLQYRVVRWGVIVVVNSNWQGANNTWVKVRKAHDFDGELRAKPGLNGTTAYIEGAYTQPVLID